MLVAGTSKWKRREFLTFLSVLISPYELFAQAQNKKILIGWLAGVSQAGAANFIQEFLKGMREIGHIEGRDFEMVYRYADGYMDRLPKLSEELVQLNPGIIIAASTIQAAAIEKVTSTIPIVVPALGDAIAAGLIATEARPGGNVTGIIPYVKGLPAKQLELAREVLPSARRIGLIHDDKDIKSVPQQQEIDAAARSLNIEIVTVDVSSPEDIRAAYQKLARQGVEIVIVEQSSMLLSARKQTAEAEKATNLPSVYGYREHVEAGGLISYGVDLNWCFHRAAFYVDKIMKGANPKDLPIEFPTNLALAINRKTAAAHNLAVPQTLIFRADRLVE